MFRDEQRREEAAREARRQSNEEAVQSAFMRGFRPQLELVSVEFEQAAKLGYDPEVRGVFKDTESFPGLAVFKVVDSAGRLRLKAEMPDSDIEDRFIERLEKWLDRHDPVAKLKAI